jgi:cytochrome P450
VFSDPDAFDIHRANARRHLTFGFGRHLCAGAPLIRNELQVVFPRLFKRIPTLRLATPAEDLPYSIETQMFGLEALPVTW